MIKAIIASSGINGLNRTNNQLFGNLVRSVGSVEKVITDLPVSQDRLSATIADLKAEVESLNLLLLRIMI